MDVPNPLDLPSVAVTARRQIPRESAVYFLLGADGNVLYIGKSVDIRQRCSQHEVIDRAQGAVVRVAWMLPDRRRSLTAVEADLIRLFQPPLNGQHTGRPGGQKSRLQAVVIAHAMTTPTPVE